MNLSVLERFRLIAHDPILQQENYNELEGVNIKALIKHLNQNEPDTLQQNNNDDGKSQQKINVNEPFDQIPQKQLNQSPDEINFGIHTMPDEQISVTEMRTAVQKLAAIESNIQTVTSQQEASHFEGIMEQNIKIMNDDSLRIDSIVQALQQKFLQFEIIQQKIEHSKSNLESFFVNFDTVKKLTAQNQDLKSQLQGIQGQNAKLLDERPLITREQWKIIENDILKLKDDNDALKNQLKKSQQKAKALHSVNESLTAERKTLLCKLSFQNEERATNTRLISEYSDDKMLLQGKLTELQTSMNEYESGRPYSSNHSINTSSTQIDKEEFKRLVEQNERLIVELKELQKQKNLSPTPEKNRLSCNNGLEDFEKIQSLENENKEKESQIRLLMNQLETEKSLNQELKMNFKTLETKYSDLQGQMKKGYHSQQQQQRWRPLTEVPPLNYQDNHIYNLNQQQQNSMLIPFTEPDQNIQQSNNVNNVLLNVPLNQQQTDFQNGQVIRQKEKKSGKI